MLAPVEALVSAPEFTNARNQVIPDPAVYSDWFARADDTRRKLAVGARRYATVQDQLGGAPDWEHFLDPETGELLTLDRLRREEPADRQARVQAARELTAQRRQDLRQVAVYGFVPPVAPSALPSGAEIAALPRTRLNPNAGQFEGASPVYRVERDGQPYFFKHAPRAAAEREETVAQLARLAGVEAPRTAAVQVGKRRGVVADFVDGTPLNRLPDRREAIRQLPAETVHRHILFGFLANMDDRHAGNYLLSNGRLVSVDHELSLGQGLSFAPVKDSVLFKALDVETDGNVPVSPAALAGIRAAAPVMAAALDARGLRADAEAVRARATWLGILAGKPSPTYADLRGLLATPPTA